MTFEVVLVAVLTIHVVWYVALRHWLKSCQYFEGLQPFVNCLSSDITCHPRRLNRAKKQIAYETEICHIPHNSSN